MHFTGLAIQTGRIDRIVSEMPDSDISRDGVVPEHQPQVVLKADPMQRLDSKPTSFRARPGSNARGLQPS